MKRFSASALKRFAACPRSWRYSRDVEPVEKASTKLGKETHTWLENYMRTTTPPDLKSKHGRLVLPGLHHLASIPRGGVAKLEQHFALEVDGFNFHGFIDLRHGRRVIDHKTTKDIGKYALTSEALADDLQRTMYAAGTLAGFVIEHAADGTELGVTDERMSERCLDGTDCAWVYYATVRPRGTTRDGWSALREHSETREATLQRFGDTVLPIARRLLPLWDAPASDFDRDLRRCEDYGGCPYQETCWKADPPTLRERAKGADMGVLDRLRAKQTAEADGAASTAASAAAETDALSEVQFSPDQQPGPASASSTTPPAGPPSSTTKTEGPRLPPKKRTAATNPAQPELPNAGGAEPGDEYGGGGLLDPPTKLHRTLPMDVVLTVVRSCTTSEEARDKLEVIADWTEVAA